MQKGFKNNLIDTTDYKEQLRAAKREKREMWKALCPACDNYRDNGAGIACIERDFMPPTMSTCPLLAKAKKARNR